MKKSLAVFVALTCLAAAPRADAADAKTELQGLVTKVQTKLQAGQNTETDLAPELKDFDALLDEHKAEKTNDVAEILFFKAMLYAEVFQNYDKATTNLQQLKTDFPATADAGKVDEIVASFARQAEASKIQNALSVGSVFPDFQVTDINGKPLSVSGEKGKLVLIDFWATWCGPCMQELPNVVKVYAAYHDKGFDVIGISLDEEKEKLPGFLKEKQVTWPQYCDGKGWESKLAATYGVNSIPATYLLGKDGKIIGKELRGEALEEAVKAGLAAN